MMIDFFIGEVVPDSSAVIVRNELIAVILS